MGTDKAWQKEIEKLDSEKVLFGITDIDGILRGKFISKKKLLKSFEENIGFCNVVFGWDSNDVVYDNTQVSGWHTGYPDAMAAIDFSTLKHIAWKNNIPFFLADFSKGGSEQHICPRTLLKKVRQRAIDLELIPQFAKEFEWFNFRETGQTLAEKQYRNPNPLSTGMFGYSVLRLAQNKEYYNDIFDKLTQTGVPIEGLHTETGDGVSEVALEYCDVLEAADRAVIFKSGVKEIASQHGFMACFMAKWNSDLPGCSGHVHQSLWNKDKTINLFYQDDAADKMSDLLKHYIAGQLYCLPHILPMYAPTVNSYKRYVEGAWASTTVSWGIENRTTALRVINHTPSSARLETRVPGADSNPYLTMAASLASGLFGIENKLELNINPTRGNEYENNQNSRLPKTLQEATAAMRSSDIAKQLFGEAFAEHFIRTREWEWRSFAQKVTDWELKRYFEII